MSSIVCLKPSYKVFREDLSACVSPLNSDPVVATREALEYTCKKIPQQEQCQYTLLVLLYDNNNNTTGFVPAVCGPAPGSSAGAAV